MKEIDPLAFLKAVYMNADLPLSVRMRAAIEVLPLYTSQACGNGSNY